MTDLSTPPRARNLDPRQLARALHAHAQGNPAVYQGRRADGVGAGCNYPALLHGVCFGFRWAGRMMGDLPYLSFLAPGLIMMSMAQNAFANTSSSIVISKVQGNIVDVLMPPLSALELTTGYTLGGIARGLAVGLASMIVLVPFASLRSRIPATSSITR